MFDTSLYIYINKIKFTRIILRYSSKFGVLNDSMCLEKRIPDPPKIITLHRILSFVIIDGQKFLFLKSD